jgi:hypothetical protein
MSESGDGEASPNLPKTVHFEHVLFDRVDEGVFRKTDTGEPVFSISIGDTQAMLSLRGMRREFDFTDDSPDAVMLDLVTRSLDFVKALRVGDRIPSELLTGKPSWKITEVHRVIAQQRLSMQLVTWLSGEEQLIMDPNQLRQIVEDPETQKRVNEALRAGAKALGLGDDKVKVLELIESLAEELAPIEALRDRMQHLRRVSGKGTTIFDVVDSTARLIEAAVADFTSRFEAIDTQTEEIMTALRNVTGQRKFIRSRRDDIFCRLASWDSILAKWRSVEQYSEEVSVELLRETYRFLAPRYMEVDQWVLLSQLQGGAGQRHNGDDADIMRSAMEW